MLGKELQRELHSAQVECDRLREENNRLRKLLTEHGISIPAIQTQGPTLIQSVGTAIDAVSHASGSKAKIALCIAKFKNQQVGLRSDYFQRMGIGRRASRRMASARGYSQFLTAELAARTWLLVALNEANQRVRFFPQKLTQAASV